MKRLTEARRRGLTVIAARELAGQHAFRSNVTETSETGLVYWQTVDWLVDQGYAERYGPIADYLVRLTDAGRELAREES